MSRLSLKLEYPFLPEGASLSFFSDYGQLTPDDEKEIEIALLFVQRTTATRSKLDSVINLLLSKAGNTNEQLAEMRRIFQTVVELLPVEDRVPFLDALEAETL